MIQHSALYRALIIFLLFLLSNLPTVQAERLVRVGWFSFSTLSTYHPEAAPNGQDALDDVPGVYGGYNYEYLRMISQINGWKLHFVYGTINESLERLAAGEVDLVGGVGRIPSREARFAFPENSALHTAIGLIARADDTRFTMNDFDSFRGMRVGAVTDSNPLFKLQEWSAKREIPLNFIYFSSFNEMYAALDAGEVDAITDGLLTPLPNRKVLVSVESQGVYFVGNKNNPQLIQELDDAMTQIQYLKPGYQEALAAKYLYAQSYSSFTLSQREKAYLDTLLAAGQPLTVSIPASWLPIAYIDPESGQAKGIMPDILERIHQLTGLQFVYRPSTSLSTERDADLYAAISTDFAWADQHDSYLSQSVFDIPVFLVSRPAQENFHTVALVKNSHLSTVITDRLSKEDNATRYHYYNTMEECLNAVREGSAGRTYLNSYELNYYMNQSKFSQLNLQPVPGLTETTSIGIAKANDPLLCSIICQALRSISPSDMNNILLKNTTFQPQHSLLDFIYTYPLASLAAAAILALLLGGILFFYYSNKKSERLRHALEATLQSRSSLLQANKELTHLSQYDKLTGLPNRRGLDEFLQHIDIGQTQLTLCMLDIDEFKTFNDTYGHLAGDNALIAVAEILQHHALVTGAFTARFGGEEFIWIDTLHVHTAIQTLLENLQHSIWQKNIPHKNTKIGHLTISIGYAEKQSGETIEELIARADEALYESKRTGRNRISYKEPLAHPLQQTTKE